jgi:putative ATP-binding cassette transporter
MLIGAVSYKMVLYKGHATLKLAREESGQLVEYFRLLTNGLKELKLHSHRRQDFLAKNLEPTAASIQRRFFTWSVMHSVTQTWAKFLVFFVMGLILFVFPHYFSFDKEILTGYILTLLYVRAMLFSIMSAMPALTNANVAFEKIEALGFKLTPEARTQVGIPAPINSWQSVELVNVSHTYYREREDSNFTLGPINLKFAPGELVFLVGGNGSGKTTLAKLITGLYTPESGNIYLNGKDVTIENRDQYRQLFSVVFADFQLFEDLLGLANPQLDAQAQNYLTKLQLDHKVKIKDGKLSTTALSRGQRQRLALLTAYLEDRPFYIFDEWASNQDPMFTEIFYTQFLPELKAKGKTILVITHDDKYFDWCDRIIKLDHGQITTNLMPAKLI